MTRAIAIQGLDHVVLRVVDEARMLHFYVDVLGCPLEKRQDDIGLVQLRAGSALIDLVPIDGELGRAGGAAPGREGRNLDHFCLAVEPFDEAAIRAHLRAHGIEAGPTAPRYGAQGEGPSMYLTDPEGNVVELKGPPGSPTRNEPMTSSDSIESRSFFHTRLIDAPRERVFSAFSDPAHLAKWWGPDGFSSTFESFDLRQGGHWKFVMHGPDGQNYPNENVFIELEPPRRVAIDHIVGHHFVLSIELIEEADGKTLVQWQQTFDTAEHRERIAPLVSVANEQNLDRWAAEVQKVVAP